MNFGPNLVEIVNIDSELQQTSILCDTKTHRVYHQKPNTKDTLHNSATYPESEKSGEIMCWKRQHMPMEGDADGGIVQDSNVVAVILC